MEHIIQKHLGSNTMMNGELFSALLAKRFTVKDLTELDSKITYRTINHWDEKGYLLTQTEEGGWRKFSFADYVWILLLDEVRELDIAVKNIIKSLFIDFGFRFNVLDEMPASEIELLRKMELSKLLKRIDREYALESFCRLLVTIISYKTPITLRFFKDGGSLPIYGNPAYHGFRFLPALNEYNQALLDSNFKSSISISIDSLIKDFVTNKDLDNISESMLLTKPEVQILKQLQEGELQQITIFFDKGKPHRIELTDMTQLADASKRVKEFFLSPYQRCEIVTNGGESCFIKRTVSKKIID